ncbi:host specificity factor TipJ family phage tail protein, partial [Tistrella arctica]|uniref:host specificity factor TipJ family phage tail protein n=1 Tax=Tistrella arctica TaxID=3133430 RepID=UPI0031F6CD9A
MELPEGATLAEMVAAAGISGVRLTATHVEIGGHMIPRDRWHRVRPRAGMMVTVRVLPLGGGGDGNKVVRSLLMIAVVAAAAWLGGPLGGFIAGEIGIGVEVATALAVTAITTVGSLLVNALVPPTQPRLSTATGDGVKTYGISDLRNVADPWGTIPKVYGRMRVWPKRAAKVVTEIVGDDQYLRVLLCAGYGPLLISEIKIGETPVGDFEDVEIEIREGRAGDAPVTLYTTDVNEEPLSVLVAKDGGPQVRTAGSGADEISIDLTWRSLIAQNDKGDQLSRRVDVRVEYRASGATEWLPVPQSGDPKPSTAVTTTANLLSRREWRTDLPIAGPVTLTGLGAVGAVRLRVYTRPAGAGAWALQRDFAADDVPAAIAVAGVDGKALDIAAVAVAADLHDTPIVVAPTAWSYLAREGTDGVWQVTGRSWSPVRRSIRWRVPVRGQYEVRVTRLTDDTDSPRISDEVYWSALRTVTDRPPVTRSGLALIALRIRATEQLNGVVDTLNCIAQAVLRDWDAATGAWIERETRSPAAAFRDVFQGVATKRPVADARLDLDAVQELAEWCAEIDPESGEPRFRFDAVYDSRSTGWDVLREIAASGRAVPSVRGGLYSVVIDRPQPGPVALITPRNAWGYSATRALVDLPHALRVRYLNADKGYEQDELIVCRDGYTVDPDIAGLPATLIEDIEVTGVVTRRQAWVLARRAMAEATLRPELHSVWQDVEALGHDRGDQVALAYDVPRIGLVSARVTGVVTDDEGRAVAVELDEPVAMEDGGLYAVRIRLGGTTRQIVPTVETMPGETRLLSFAAPVPAVDAPSADDLAVFGEAERETVQLIVKSIEYGDNLSVRLTLVDAAPAIHTAEDAPIPAYDPLITLDPEVVAPGQVLGLRLAEIARPGEARTSIRATWQPPAAGFAGGYEVYGREGLGLRWRMIGATTAPVWTVTEQARPGETYEVLVLAVGPSGARTPLRDAATAQITAAGDPIYARPPVAVTPRPGIGQIIVEITPTDDPRAVEYEVVVGVVDDVTQGDYVGRVRGTVITIPEVPAGEGRYVWARSIDAFGRPGPWAPRPVIPEIPTEPGEDPEVPVLPDIPEIPTSPGAEYPWPTVPGVPAVSRAVLEDDLSADVSGRLDLIDRSMVGDAAGGLMQRIETAAVRAGERAAAADRDIREALERLAVAQIDAALRVVDTRGLVRDAGIEIDPADGRVKIRAVEALATDTTRRLSDVSVVLDAQAAAIDLRATRSELADVEGETLTRFGSVEATLDAQAGAIDLRATKGELAALGAELLEQIQPAARWEYHDSAEGWAATAGTLTPGGAGLVTLTGAAPARMAVSGLAIDGAAAWIVAIRLRRVAGSGWGVRVGWSTASGSDEVAVTAPADPAAWSVVQAVLRGRASWDGRTVQGLAVSAGEAAGDGFEIDFVEVARSGAQALILDGLEGRLGSTEARLDAAEGVIELKADVVTVADHAARLGSAEARLDAAEGAIDLRATVSDLTAAQTRIGSAEARIDAAEAAINLKADETIVTAQGQQIAEVSAELDAIDGRISLVVSDVIERVDGVSDAAALAALAGALGQADEGAVRRTDAAMARQDLTARVDAATGAVARSVEQLAVRVGDTAAEVAVERVTRASETEALASEVTGLRARVGVAEGEIATATAAIASESTARATADQAIAEDLVTLTADVGAASAAIIAEAQARVTADTALAGEVTGISARVGAAEGRLGDAEAAITSVSQAVADVDAASARTRDQLVAYVDAGDQVGAGEADKVATALLASVVDGADAGAARREDGAAIRRDVVARVEAGEIAEAAQREVLAVRLGATEAGIVLERITRATEDAALAADLSTLAARVDGAEADITTEEQARADADGALAALVTTLSARADAADDAIAAADAAVVIEALARASEDDALAAQISTLTADVGAASSAITAEAQARVTADTALAGEVTGISARVGAAEGRLGDAEAAITSVSQAVADVDAASARTR